ncbi:deoxynucleoside triphosphate triphosphohydrolase SAMHD1-like isoform X2 [Amphiura filiformis]|uniref:deoxynucleoside triphosphate triphosphohydrolase SAMHD1-like isoform X2 n=1 Tax=Amphiura filiformis TaxID=82378 RepID=UPI003B2195A5
MATKTFRDPVHQSIELSDYLVTIIDTQEFQRLRHIKQLGYAEAVYPGGNHSRFSHSLGTCYLAGRVMRTLKEKQDLLEISENDIKLVEIAGLCHDLGHGPFSHKFQEVVEKVTGEKWKHETASVEILTLISGRLSEKLQLEEDYITTIKRIILGDPPKDKPKKKFMFQIVCNEDTGIDVDKWDYFARDCHYVGIRNDFDHEHLLKFLRVVQVGDNYELGFRDKEAENVKALFDTRFKLHRRVYQHRVVGLLEKMINEVLIGYFNYTEELGETSEFVISKIIDGMRDRENKEVWDESCRKYCQMDDRILSKIAISKEPELEPTRDLLKQIEERQFYKLAAVIQSKPSWSTEEGKDGDERGDFELADQVQAETNPITFTLDIKISQDDIEKVLANDEFKKYSEGFLVVKHKFSHGKDKHPLLKVPFFKKYQANEIPKGTPLKPHQIPPSLPKDDQLEWTVFRVYTKTPLKKGQTEFRREIDLKLRALYENRTPEDRGKKRKGNSGERGDVKGARANLLDRY